MSAVPTVFIDINEERQNEETLTDNWVISYKFIIYFIITNLKNFDFAQNLQNLIGRYILI